MKHYFQIFVIALVCCSLCAAQEAVEADNSTSPQVSATTSEIPEDEIIKSTPLAPVVMDDETIASTTEYFTTFPTTQVTKPISVSETSAPVTKSVTLVAKLGSEKIENVTATEAPKFRSNYSIWILLLAFFLVLCLALSILIFAVLLCYISNTKRRLSRRVYNLQAELDQINKDRSAQEATRNRTSKYSRINMDTYGTLPPPRRPNQVQMREDSNVYSGSPILTNIQTMSGCNTFKKLKNEDSIQEDADYDQFGAASTYKAFEDPAGTPSTEMPVYSEAEAFKNNPQSNKPGGESQGKMAPTPNDGDYYYNDYGN